MPTLIASAVLDREKTGVCTVYKTLSAFVRVAAHWHLNTVENLTYSVGHNVGFANHALSHILINTSLNSCHALQPYQQTLATTTYLLLRPAGGSRQKVLSSSIANNASQLTNPRANFRRNELLYTHALEEK